ncbi:glycosyltransferase [Nitratidesulfovibrio termitidis]|uniref:glycosyltransferase n=1 Tax=Nitratidesulfovibrio termitidis TaxID=42252 RepID=UPI00040C15C0|nr:glycosyltransferase [Nitratidesulfovibrio termitidis]
MHMRPVVFRLTSSLHYGGVASRLRAILPLLLDEFEVHVVTYRTPGAFAPELADRGVRVHHLPIPTKWSPTGIARLARMLRAHGASVLHNHSFSANVTGALAGALAGTPVRIGQIHTLQSHWYDNPAHRAKQRIEEMLIHRILSTRVLHVSRESLRYFAAQMPLAAAKFELLHNGVDFSALAPRKEAARLRSELGIPPHVRVIGNVGRVTGCKRLELILSTAASALAQDPDMVFVIVGGSQRQAEGLCRQAHEMGIGDKVFCPGETPHPGDYYNIFDAFIFTSPPGSEGMPGAVLEAASFGMPVVAIRTDTLEEMAEWYDGFHFITDGSDPAQELSAALTAALAAPRPDPTRLRAHFSIQAMADRTRALYHHLLRQHAPRT